MQPTVFLPLLDNGLGMCRVEYVAALLRASSGARIHFAHISDSHPGRARNRAAAHFLRTEAEYMLFIDTDIVFTPQHMACLMESNEPVLGGVYPLKCADLKLCMQTLPGKPVDFSKRERQETARLGTGFLRIHRSVFEAMKRPEIRYTNHGHEEWDFFQSGVVDDEWLSEDWYFCDAARKAGFKVMVDPRIQLLHVGSIEYPLKKRAEHLQVCPDDMKPWVDTIFAGEYAMDLDRPPEEVLDIGGNIGGFTVWAREQWPNSDIHAYEPHPDNAALFRMNTRHLPRVKLFQKAVTNHNGKAVLTEGANSGMHSLKFKNADVGRGQLEVECAPADRIGSAEFVKIDAEGCEVEILEKLDLTRTRAIALEYHSQPDCEAIKCMLTGRGFSIVQHQPHAAERGILKFKKDAPCKSC